MNRLFFPPVANRKHVKAIGSIGVDDVVVGDITIQCRLRGRRPATNAGGTVPAGRPAASAVRNLVRGVDSAEGNNATIIAVGEEKSALNVRRCEFMNERIAASFINGRVATPQAEWCEGRDRRRSHSASN